MKKIFISFLLLVLGLLIWQWVRTQKPIPATQAVVVSGYVPYTLVHQLVGDAIPIEMLLPAGTEPHAFEPTPFVLVQLQRAGAFIFTSAVLEPWAADLAKSVPSGVPVLQLDKQISSTTDPHSWMNLHNGQVMAYQVAVLLAQLEAVPREKLDENYLQLAQELEELEKDFARTLASCQYKEVVHIGHSAFGNLLTPYGIKLTALAGSSHEGEQSAKKIVELIREIKDKNLPAIFTEETISPRLAQTVAAETGVDILKLYPIEHISKTDFEARVTYADLMRRNLQNLARGLQCPSL